MNPKKLLGKGLERTNRRKMFILGIKLFIKISKKINLFTITILFTTWWPRVKSYEICFFEFPVTSARQI